MLLAFLNFRSALVVPIIPLFPRAHAPMIEEIEQRLKLYPRHLHEVGPIALSFSAANDPEAIPCEDLATALAE